MRKLLPWYALALLVVLLDQLTKYWISASLRYGEARAYGEFFNLVLTHNRGAAFSFLASAAGWQRGFFIAIALIAIVVIGVLLARHARDKLFCLSLALILGGAIGNVIDRIVLGYVVDFLDFHLSGWHWPAFNLADSAITAGAVLLVADSFRSGAKRAGAAP
ncbi:MAG: lipoprotein signal peptidase [Burkholderiales bacterium]|nr:lipoprotein signal peptidase [Burkholderiales bacterium]